MTTRQANLMRRARRAPASARALEREGLLEDAVSRVYYAMFHAARALLDAEGLRFKSHSGVLSAFGQLAKAGKIPRELHRHLIDASDERSGGDYDETYSADADTVAKQIQRAEGFVNAAEEFLHRGSGAT